MIKKAIRLLKENQTALHIHSCCFFSPRTSATSQPFFEALFAGESGFCLGVSQPFLLLFDSAVMVHQHSIVVVQAASNLGQQLPRLFAELLQIGFYTCLPTVHVL